MALSYDHSKWFMINHLPHHNYILQVCLLAKYRGQCRVRASGATLGSLVTHQWFALAGRMLLSKSNFDFLNDSPLMFLNSPSVSDFSK